MTPAWIRTSGLWRAAHGLFVQPPRLEREDYTDLFVFPSWRFEFFSSTNGAAAAGTFVPVVAKYRYKFSQCAVCIFNTAILHGKSVYARQGAN